MRLKLTLKCPPNGIISMNYAYALQAVIYKVLKQADPEFSHWLHEKGYDHYNKKFKLFSFDLLRGLYRNDFETKTMRFLDGNLEWRISFCVDEAVEKFVIGLFKNQKLSIITPEGRIDCTVQGVEIIPLPSFTQTMRFRAAMPICVSEKKETDKHAQYLSPDDAHFEQLFFGNLNHKYCALYKDNALKISAQPTLKILNTPKSKKFDVIKKEVDKRTEVRGFVFDFEITAPIEWIKMGYEAGFGGKNSSGFGYCEVLK
jgi:CRISPR-associated endoribonuclease Cas6